MTPNEKIQGHMRESADGLRGRRSQEQKVKETEREINRKVQQKEDKEHGTGRYKRD